VYVEKNSVFSVEYTVLVTVRPSAFCYRYQAMQNHLMASKPCLVAWCISATTQFYMAY